MKYEQLWIYLQNDGSDKIRLTFEQIKDILGFEIDHSFQTYKKEAALFGYVVGKISLKEKHVNFERLK